MPQRPTDLTVAGQVEFAVRRLKQIDILPSVAAACMSRFDRPGAPSIAFADIIESDPALVVLILNTARQKGIAINGPKFSIRHILNKLPAPLLRDALISASVFDPSSHFADAERILRRTELTRHSIAVACCAKTIAETTLGTFDPDHAYTAGLLHDIGKFALAQLMPKSFAKVVEQARSLNCSTTEIEKKHLGIDHATLGKRLAQRWPLPQPVALAIWLHHMDIAAISSSIPQAEIAQIVRLADCIARKSAIGDGGSGDSTDAMAGCAAALEIAPEKLQQIIASLPEQVAGKSELLGLDMPDPARTLADATRAAAAQFAAENAKLTEENRKLQTSSSHVGFSSQFLAAVNTGDEPIDVAESFAVCWQKFYQTGKVCLYLVPAGSTTLQTVVVENLAQSSVTAIEAPANAAIVPPPLAEDFDIIDAPGHIDWLFDQLETEFDLIQTKLMPVRAAGRAVAVLAFELRYPGDIDSFGANFQAATSTAGIILDMAVTCSDRQIFAERFAQLLAAQPQQVEPAPSAEVEPPPTRPQVGDDDSFEALTEMAAGAAHELNNPLSVISGRAQLLADAETDDQKKESLVQIRQNAAEISGIINDLMTFARPPKPRPGPIRVKQILDEAVELAHRMTGAEHINVQTELADEIDTVFVDSAQVVSSLANIICNCIESYTDVLGPVKIIAVPRDDQVKLQISDLGRGMDEQTAARAAAPFFSALPAGRKRGMGLAHARRFIELNKGSIKIITQPQTGTTITILLPAK